MRLDTPLLDVPTVDYFSEFPLQVSNAILKTVKAVFWCLVTRWLAGLHGNNSFNETFLYDKLFQQLQFVSESITFSLWMWLNGVLRTYGSGKVKHQWYCSSDLEDMTNFISTIYSLREITGDYLKLLKITENNWRLLEITGNYWRLLEITGNYWRLLEITGDSNATFAPAA